MSLAPTRRWVKEHLSAYICCETSPIASLWIRFFVWICPECRREHQELKAVWDHLEDWGASPPSEDLESNFSRTFRQKFPSAFESEKEAPLPRTGDFVLRFAYTSAVVLLGAAVFLMQDSPTSNLERVARSTPSVPGPQIADAAPAAAPVSPSLSFQPEPQPVVSQPPVRMDSRLLNPDVLVLTGSHAPASRGAATRDGRTVEINNWPMTGFDTLLTASNDRSY